MCLILIAENISDITDNVNLLDAWRSNSDGAGIAYLKNGEIRVKKGLMNYKSFSIAVDRIPKKCPIAIHLRLATHGSVSRDNCHPFPVRDHYLMHNGVITALGKSGKHGESDSAHLARILTRLPERERLPLLGSIYGRFAYISQREILHVGQFEERKGVLLSNLNFEPSKLNWLDKKTWNRKDWVPERSTITIYRPQNDEIQGSIAGLSDVEIEDRDEIRALTGLTIDRKTGEIIDRGDE